MQHFQIFYFKSKSKSRSTLNTLFNVKKQLYQQHQDAKQKIIMYELKNFTSLEVIGVTQ